jgi:regulator of sirC expression with transglutaminase-like and TPR domain
VHRQSVIKELLTLLSAEKESDMDLGKAALLLSKFDNPDLDPASYLAELDSIGAEIKAVLTEEEKKDGLKRMERMVNWLFKENGYHGSRDDYESKPNSYLNEVIDDREGIPISLSVLVMELGRRLDIPVAGVPIPGHFMVQYRSADLPEGGPYFDVFDGGKKMDQAELALHLGFAGSLPEESFVPAGKKQIIIRMVRNLIGPQLNAKASEALPYLNLVLALSPEETSERFSRAIVLYQKGDRRQAKVDIQWLLDKAPAGLDLERLQEWLDRIEAEEGR